MVVLAAASMAVVASSYAAIPARAANLPVAYTLPGDGIQFV
jgi:hypothetical protein